MDSTAARQDAQALQQSIVPGSVIVASTGMVPFEQVLLHGRHTLRADQPITVGGGDVGPGPYELLLMALGSCTSMTINMYATRKKWALDQVVVRLRHERRDGSPSSALWPAALRTVGGAQSILTWPASTSSAISSSNMPDDTPGDTPVVHNGSYVLPPR